MASSPTLVVLAAGLGSRYGGLKQMDGVGPSGELLLEYAVHDAARAGFGRVVFVIRRDLEADFRARLGDRCARFLPVAYAYQELHDLPAGFAPPPGRTKPWGTGHALHAARDLCRGHPVAVINADDWYGREAYATLVRALAEPAPAGSPPRHVLVAYRLDRTLSEHGAVSRGVAEVDARGHLVRLVEHTRIESGPQGPVSLGADGSRTPLPADAPVSMNLFGFQPPFWDGLGRDFAAFLGEHGSDPKSEFYLPSAVNAQIARGEAVVAVRPTEASWFGVTYPEDREPVRARLAALAASGEYRTPLAP